MHNNEKRGERRVQARKRDREQASHTIRETKIQIEFKPRVPENGQGAWKVVRLVALKRATLGRNGRDRSGLGRELSHDCTEEGRGAGHGMMEHVPLVTVHYWYILRFVHCTNGIS